MSILTVGGSRCISLLLLPLLLHVPVLAPPVLPSGLTESPVILSSGYYVYFPIDAYMNGTVVSYSLTSNASVTTAFLTSTQLAEFGSGQVFSSMAYHNGSSDSQTLQVTAGSYDILVYAYDDGVNATLSLTVYPNNPLGLGPLAPPEPSGIATYGIANQSGTDTPYAVASTDVVGVAVVSALDAYNATAGSVGANPSGATLQLNSMLVVDERGGGSQVYWCQNTPDFVTATSQVALADNVWNSSVSGFLSNESVTSEGGGGYVSVLQQQGATEYYYAYEKSNYTYSLPLAIALFVNATAVPGTGVLVQFGAQMSGVVRTDWFDNVTIHDPSVTDAYFFTAGNYTTPTGTFYDTELVFGGEGGGESTMFTRLSAGLGLYYANGTSTYLNAFPSYFSFGQDTAESAGDIAVQYLGEGRAEVSVGTPDYTYLGAASGTFSLQAVEALLASPGTNSTVLSESSSSTVGSGIPEFPYQLAGVAIFAALVSLSYLRARRKIIYSPNGLRTSNQKEVHQGT
ncbi:MAG: thermopsin family protease [Nitrososphaerota archaeon]|nr:thermopsin family protease [Nitrososphaerota archaeon]